LGYAFNATSEHKYYWTLLLSENEASISCDIEPSVSPSLQPSTNPSSNPTFYMPSFSPQESMLKASIVPTISTFPSFYPSTAPSIHIPSLAPVILQEITEDATYESETSKQTKILLIALVIIALLSVQGLLLFCSNFCCLRKLGRPQKRMPNKATGMYRENTRMIYMGGDDSQQSEEGSDMPAFKTSIFKSSDGHTSSKSSEPRILISAEMVPDHISSITGSSKSVGNSTSICSNNSLKGSECQSLQVFINPIDVGKEAVKKDSSVELSPSFMPGDIQGLPGRVSANSNSSPPHSSSSLTYEINQRSNSFLAPQDSKPSFSFRSSSSEEPMMARNTKEVMSLFLLHE